MILCMNCGNRDKFIKDYDVLIYEVDTVTIDGHTEEELESEIVSDGETERHGIVNFYCKGCASLDVREHLTDKQINILIWKHTRKNGEWSKVELPEEERDKKLKDQLMINSI